ncbi:biotin/lipoyl-binding protein [Vibrio harveyi]|nr:biotin/lipoyl-binding protein [Vibrio harveyi]
MPLLRAPVNAELQAKVLDGKEAITCRPADLLEAEMETLTVDLMEKAQSEGIKLASERVDDVLTYALFPQVGLKFLKNRGNPDAFEPAPTLEAAKPAAAQVTQAAAGGVETYSVRVDGQVYEVEVGPQGQLTSVTPSGATAPVQPAAPNAPVNSAAEAVPAPLAGNIFKVNVQPGAEVAEGDVLLILEAMKMETEVRAARGGVVQELNVKEGDAVTVGSPLLSLA